VSDYGTLETHAAAALDLLRDALALTSVDVYPVEGGGLQVVPNGTAPPYVAVHFDADRPIGGRLHHRSTRFRMRMYANCVGLNDAAARQVSDLVAAAWLDVKPVVAGRACYPIRSETGRDPRLDESTGATVVTISDAYRLESDPGHDGS